MIRELDRVKTRVENTLVPAGAIGTVVSIYPDGDCQVEFTFGTDFDTHYHVAAVFKATELEMVE